MVECFCAARSHNTIAIDGPLLLMKKAYTALKLQMVGWKHFSAIIIFVFDHSLVKVQVWIYLLLKTGKHS